MSHGFLPRTDASLLNWALNFSTRISAEHESLGISLEQAEAFEQLRVTFAAKMQLCFPEIRNKVATTGKNQARAELKANAKLLSTLIHGQANVSDAQKIELGLNVRKAPTATPAPANPPGVSVISTRQNTATLHLTQTGTDTGLRGRPRGVTGAVVFTYEGELPPSDARDWRFHGIRSATTFDVAFDSSVTPGTTVWFTACWLSTRKQTGPMGHPVSTNLAGGGVGPASSMRMAA